MKKLLKISFLLAVLCLAVPVYADGDLPAGNKTCTQNCGFYDGTNPDQTVSSETKQNDLTVDEIYSWILEQISDLVD